MNQPLDQAFIEILPDTDTFEKDMVKNADKAFSSVESVAEQAAREIETTIARMAAENGGDFLALGEAADDALQRAAESAVSSMGRMDDIVGVTIDEASGKFTEVTRAAQMAFDGIPVEAKSSMDRLELLAVQAAQEIEQEFKKASEEVQASLDKQAQAAATEYAKIEADGKEAASEIGSSFENMAGASIVAIAGIGAAMADTMSRATPVIENSLVGTSADFERYGQIAGDLFSSGVAPGMQEANEAIIALGSSLPDFQSYADSDIEAMSASLLNMSEIMGIDVTEAAQTAGQMIKNNLADDGKEAFDILLAGAKLLPAQMRAELPSVLAEYSADFMQLGLTGEQAMAALAASVDAGSFSIDKSADALRELSTRILSMEAAEPLAELGLNAQGLADAFAAGGEQASTALGEIFTALEEVDGQAQDTAGVALFGSMWEDTGAEAVLALNPLNAEIDGVKDATDSLNESMADSPTQQLNGAFNTMRDTLSSALLPVIKSFSDWMSENQGTVENLATTLLLVAGAVTAINAALKIYQATVVVIQAVTKAWTVIQWLLNVAMNANPLGLIVLAIAAVVAAIIWISMESEAFRDFFVGVWETIWGFLTGVFDWISENWPLLLAILTGPIGLAIKWIVDNWDMIWTNTKNTFNNIFTFLKNLWNNIWGFITGLVGNIVGFITDTFWGMINAIKSIVGNIGTTIWNAIVGAFNKIKNVWKWFKNIGRDIVQGIINGLSNAARNLYDFVWDLASNALQSIKNFFGIGSPSKVMAAEVGKPIVQGMEVGAEDESDNLDNTLSQITSSSVQAARTGSTTGTTGNGSDTGGITFGPGSIAVSFNGATPSEEEAFRTGQAVGHGISDTIARRNVRAQVRTI